MYKVPGERERRHRMLWVSPQLMLHALFRPTEQGGKIRWVTAEGMPDGVEIVGVHYSYERGCFGLTLFHPSFDVVPPEDFPPHLPVVMTAHEMPAPSQRHGPEFL